MQRYIVSSLLGGKRWRLDSSKLSTAASVVLTAKPFVVIIELLMVCGIGTAMAFVVIGYRSQTTSSVQLPIICQSVLSSFTLIHFISDQLMCQSLLILPYLPLTLGDRCLQVSQTIICQILSFMELLMKMYIVR